MTKYDHRCWARGENDCDMKCDSKIFPTKEHPCGWLCNACRCTSCNQSGIKSHDLTQLQTKSDQAEPVKVPQYERD